MDQYYAVLEFSFFNETPLLYSPYILFIFIDDNIIQDDITAIKFLMKNTI